MSLSSWVRGKTREDKAATGCSEPVTCTPRRNLSKSASAGHTAVFSCRTEPLPSHAPHAIRHSAPAWLGISVAALLLAILFACSPPSDRSGDLEPPVQNTLHYLDRTSSGKELITGASSAELKARFAGFYFSPWHRDAPVWTKSHVEAELEKYRRNPGYGENHRRHSRAWVYELERNIALQNYPNASFKAIATVNTSLRTLPTLKPHFSSPKDSSTARPFDNFQNSAIHAGSPLFISHTTIDGAWVLAESGFAYGWIPVRDMARVDSDFMAVWESSEQIAILKDGTAVCDEATREVLFKAGLGAQFPGRINDETDLSILVPIPGENRQATIRKAFVSRGAGAVKPLPLTTENIAGLSAHLLEKPYGWGGIHQRRDCSSTLKDLFAPFDIWLPRHSAHQAMEGGTFMSLQGLTDEAKEAKIVEEAAPFTTLLWARGHIMLYIGSARGRAMIFHNSWGIRTVDSQGKKGKRIIGKVVISSLHPGAALPDADLSKGDLIARIEGMTFLLPIER